MTMTESNWRERLLSYTQETTLHGINHVTATHRHRLIRMLWAVLFLLALSGFLYYLVSGLIRFQTYPVATHMDYQLLTSLSFPSVTLCNYNLIKKSYVDSLNNPYIAMALSATGQLQADAIALEEMRSAQMDRIGESSAHQRDMFQACNFMSRNYSEFPCRFSDELLTSVKTQVGFCYTFNPLSYIEKHGERPMVSERAGSAGGLFFLIDIQQDDYMTGTLTSATAGLKVLVHDPKEEPLMKELGYSIAPNTETNLVIAKVEFDNLPPPYEGSDCVETNPERNTSFVNPLKRYKYYSYSACKMECKINYTYSQCGCVGYFNKGMEGEGICDVYRFTRCMKPAIDSYNRNSSIESACGCFRPCGETKYTVTQSSALYPADFVMDSLERKLGVTADYIRKNYAVLNVYFGELGYTKITQRSDYPPSSLFAEVGGLCGLFLGASLLTLAELADVCAAVLALVCRESGKRSTKVKQIQMHVDEKPG